MMAMLDFDELQEFPKISSWATLEVHARSAVYGASHIIICITLENRTFKDLINIKVTFDLDFDLGSHI